MKQVWDEGKRIKRGVMKTINQEGQAKYDEMGVRKDEKGVRKDEMGVRKDEMRVRKDEIGRDRQEIKVIGKEKVCKGGLGRSKDKIKRDKKD